MHQNRGRKKARLLRRRGALRISKRDFYHGQTGVSKFANGELKRVLHMAAISSIQHNPELKQYYNRKVEEGKSKMSVINAVRNKLLHRIVAVVKRGTPYQTTLKNTSMIA